MGYTERQFKKAVERFGEVFFVLDSGVEYEVHGTNSYEFKPTDGEQFVRVEGLQGDEWLVVKFKLEDIEHHYSHREV